jgi:phosphomannomutase/phosphoglucomutase
MNALPKEIFKAYDIRGIVGKTLTAEIVEKIGHAIGSEAVARNQKAIVIGRDGRLSGPEFAAALARGIQKSGINVIDVGRVATPMTYFAAYQLETYSAVMITGSHNPPEYNGLKMVLGGETLSGETIQ